MDEELNTLKEIAENKKKEKADRDREDDDDDSSSNSGGGGRYQLRRVRDSFAMDYFPDYDPENPDDID